MEPNDTLEMIDHLKEYFEERGQLDGTQGRQALNLLDTLFNQPVVQWRHVNNHLPPYEENVFVLCYPVGRDPERLRPEDFSIHIGRRVLTNKRGHAWSVPSKMNVVAWVKLFNIPPSSFTKMVKEANFSIQVLDTREPE